MIAKSYGGGSLASYGGYLYWGTMQVPGTGSVVLQEAYPDIDFSKVSSAYDATYGTRTSDRVAGHLPWQELCQFLRSYGRTPLRRR